MNYYKLLYALKKPPETKGNYKPYISIKKFPINHDTVFLANVPDRRPNYKEIIYCNFSSKVLNKGSVINYGKFV